MALSNAERQQRYRERLKARARAADRLCDTGEIMQLKKRIALLEAELARGGTKLSAADLEDCLTIALDAMFPFPEDRSTLPRFMGWDRLDWAMAPDAIVAHFDMTEAVECWRDGLVACPDEMPEALRACVDAYVSGNSAPVIRSRMRLTGSPGAG